jgi:hypothetical protein
MDRCHEVSPFCAKFKVLKAECLAYLARYSEAEINAKLIFNYFKAVKFIKNT